MQDSFKPNDRPSLVQTKNVFMGSPGTPQYFSYEDSQEGPGGTDQSGEKFLSSKG